MPARPVTRYRQMAAAPRDVWALLSAPGHLEECHPFCAANPVDRWPGRGAQDRIEYYNGRLLTRRFVDWRDGAGYDIEITDANGPVAGVEWRLGGSRAGAALAISITPRMLGGAPAPLAAAAQVLVRPQLGRYLRAVLSGIEWRVTTGQPVRRNQFGAHRWFSPPERA